MLLTILFCNVKPQVLRALIKLRLRGAHYGMGWDIPPNNFWVGPNFLLIRKKSVHEKLCVVVDSWSKILLTLQSVQSVFTPPKELGPINNQWDVIFPTIFPYELLQCIPRRYIIFSICIHNIFHIFSILPPCFCHMSYCDAFELGLLETLFGEVTGVWRRAEMGYFGCGNAGINHRFCGIRIYVCRFAEIGEKIAEMRNCIPPVTPLFERWKQIFNVLLSDLKFCTFYR